VFGNGRLFDQLAGLFGAGNPGEAFDEQSFLGKYVYVELGKNKKGYTTVLYVSASSKAAAPAPAVKVKVAATPATAAETPEDLPWEEATA